MTREIEVWGDHEDDPREWADPDEFPDWDAYERARPGRENRSGVVTYRPDPHFLFRPRWHLLYDDPMPDDVGSYRKCRTVMVNSKYL